MMFAFNNTLTPVTYTFGTDRVIPPNQGFTVNTDEGAYLISLAVTGVTVTELGTRNTSSPQGGRGADTDDNSATTSAERALHPRPKSNR